MRSEDDQEIASEQGLRAGEVGLIQRWMLSRTHSVHPAHFNEVPAEESEHLGPLRNNLLLTPPLGGWPFQAPHQKLKIQKLLTKISAPLGSAPWLGAAHTSLHASPGVAKACLGSILSL